MEQQVRTAIHRSLTSPTSGNNLVPSSKKLKKDPRAFGRGSAPFSVGLRLSPPHVSTQ